MTSHQGFVCWTNMAKRFDVSHELSSVGCITHTQLAANAVLQPIH